MYGTWAPRSSIQIFETGSCTETRYVRELEYYFSKSQRCILPGKNILILDKNFKLKLKQYFLWEFHSLSNEHMIYGVTV